MAGSRGEPLAHGYSRSRVTVQILHGGLRGPLSVLRDPSFFQQVPSSKLCQQVPSNMRAFQHACILAGRQQPCAEFLERFE
jgi:hypothetical protein